MIFPNTNWATLAAATMSGGEAERAALDRFCSRYWEPVSIAIRSRGAPSERVDDLTQDFFLKLMQSGFVRKAAENRGKFRSFLLKALKDFLADDYRKTMANKRGGGLERVELTPESASIEDDDLPFDSAWAEAIFSEAVATTQAEIEKKRGPEKWAALRFFVTGSGEVTTYEALAAELDSNIGAAKTEVSRVRAKFREHLRTAVAQTVSAPHEIDEELSFLREVMTRKSS